MAEELKYWTDKDQPPYVKGENPYYDAVLEELVEQLVKDVESGKFRTSDPSDNDARYDKR